jgi:WD40 repeat protein
MIALSCQRTFCDLLNRWLVTASNDKTARLWELAGQREAAKLVYVLRPPLGEGYEGILYSVAISPDSQTLAVGGWDSPDGRNNSIYLFERGSGRMVQRLRELPNVITHLVFSPDGRYLAATLGESGVRVYDTMNWRLAGEDRDYSADSFWADFDSAGRLVTSCYDGYLRLYARPAGGELQLTALERTTGGTRPFLVKFAPASSESERVAVGFSDTTKVEVYSGRDLKQLYAADTRGVDNGNLLTVAWSWDGGTLYAGGRYGYVNGDRPIRAWSNGGRGNYRDVVVAHSTVMEIIGLRGGGIIYGAQDPAFGLVSEDGRRTLFKGPDIADYRDSLTGFLLANDGAEVQFGYELFGKSPTQFRLSGRHLGAAPGTAANLRAPLIKAPGLTVSDWRNQDNPKLNGRAMNLVRDETSYSLAIELDSKQFLLGTSFFLRFFDRNGVEQWKKEISSPAWSINISGNGKLVAAAFGDGTIRWYRLSDRQELLAFFPHNDRQRWVLWTPQGYYDTSPGAEELIGWHVNNGPDQAADFFPVGKFRDIYYRPDVISRVLKTRDEAEAVRLADAEAGRKRQEAEIAKRLPPVVEIIAPADGAEVSNPTVTVRYRVRTPADAPASEVRALIDGRPVAVERRLVQAAEQVLSVTIPPRDLELALIAENQFAPSVPAVVRLKWRGRVVTEAELIKPTLYVLAVGVSRYAHPQVKQLQFAHADARDFAAAWLKQKGGLYRDVVTHVLTDEQATKDAVLDGFEWILKQTTSRDVAVIFLAGHGENDNYGSYFFCPYNIDPDKTLRTGIADEIKKTIRDVAGKVLVFLDTCRAGNALGDGTRRSGTPDLIGLINELSSAENGAMVFSAATGRQASLERREWGHGAFTLAAIEGLKGKADFTGKGKITLRSLDFYIAERVKELTGGKQAPVSPPVPKPLQDLPIAVRQ